MNTQTPTESSSQPCRSSRIEGVPVIHRGRKVARVVRLGYDHSARRVRNFSVQVSRTDKLRTLWWYGLQEFNQKHFLLNDQVDLNVLWHPAGQRARAAFPVVRLSSVQEVVHIHDAWVDLQAGQVLAYELSFLPRQAPGATTTCVAADQLTWREDHFTLGTFPRLSLSLCPSSGAGEQAESEVNLCVS
ncbi:hypothetical protein [Deinococcus sp. UYEF24]